MDFTIAHNYDVALADRLERGVGWIRGDREVDRRFRHDPENHFVACAVDGTVLGSSACVVHPATPETPALAWICAMIVQPPHRGQGVGRRLLREALAYAEHRGASVVGLDATELGRPLYESEGFQGVTTSTRWKRLPDTVPPPLPPLEDFAIYPLSSAELRDLSHYDSPRFGANRAPWLAEVLHDLPQRAFLAYDRTSGALAGYALGQEEFIGPLVTQTPEVARWLLHACEQAGTPPVVHALDSNASALRVLAQAGYGPTEARVARMAYGGPLPGRAETQFAVGAWAFG